MLHSHTDDRIKLNILNCTGFCKAHWDWTASDRNGTLHGMQDPRSEQNFLPVRPWQWTRL